MINLPDLPIPDQEYEIGLIRCTITNNHVDFDVVTEAPFYVISLELLELLGNIHEDVVQIDGKKLIILEHFVFEMVAHRFGEDGIICRLIEG